MFPSAMLTEVCDVIPGGIGLANSGGLAGRYISMATYERVAVCIYLKPASGTDKAQVTLKQAKNVQNSPVTEKELAFSTVGHIKDAAVSADLVITGVTNNGFYTSDAAKEEVFVIDIGGADLDVENGFDCVRADVTDPGSNSTPCEITYIGYPRKYGDHIFPQSGIDTVLPL